MVFLAHGFLRDLSSMRGWAALWASHGVTVTVASLPNSTWFSGRHERNAADLRALARALHEGPVLYAGFSAGGLAALLAAAQDPSSIGYLGLDPVDSRGLAGAAARAFFRPALFLFGEPSAENARNNLLKALPIHDRPEMILLRVRHATHRAFENPTDPERGRSGGLETIRCLATAWVVASTGVEPAAGAMLAEAQEGRSPWSERVSIPPERNP
jgi:pimeloyl-ACP methyl ester carboxylesterase